MVEGPLRATGGCRVLRLGWNGNEHGAGRSLRPRGRTGRFKRRSPCGVRALPGSDARVCKGEPEADARGRERISAPEPPRRVAAQPDDPPATPSADEGAYDRVDGARGKRDHAQGLCGFAAGEVSELTGRSGVIATELDETRRVLETAGRFWISAVRADGRPFHTGQCRAARWRKFTSPPVTVMPHGPAL